jgi:hypothetical protein
VAWFSASPSPAERAAPPGHRSQALKALLDSLRPESRSTVLDLGPPLAGNIEFLSALSCRVRIADLHRSLCAESIENRQAEAMDATLARLLPLAPDEHFDAMLAWDVFDYMRPDQVSSLMARLTTACRPEALVLVLASTRRQIPAAPLRYRILDHESMAGDGPLDPLRAGPRHGQPDSAHDARLLGQAKALLAAASRSTCSPSGRGVSRSGRAGVVRAVREPLVSAGPL